MVKTPCPQRAPNQSTFLWFHIGVVKLNNEWGLASWAGLLGVRFGIPSCFDVWRQPPIMESIIAQCSLSFVLSSLFNPLAYSRLRAFARFLLSLSSLYIPFPISLPPSLFLSLSLLALSIFILLHEGCEGKDLFRIGRNYTDTESRRTDSSEGQLSPDSGI